MRQLYEIVKGDSIDFDIKVLTAIFDHQGQIKRMPLFKYIQKHEDIENVVLDTGINKLIKSAKVRIDPDTTIRINVDGFNMLKDFFSSNHPTLDKLEEKEVIVTVILNTEMPTLSKLASKVYKRKVEYGRDIQTMNECMNEINCILDRYQLTTQPLKDPNNDLEVSEIELMDTAKTRLDLEKWKEQLPKSMKLAFKLQLRQYGNDRILKTIYDEIYRYEKWSIVSKKNN